jgi:hypothetical protein
MGIGHPPHNKKDRLGVLLRAADNVVPLRHRGDEFIDLLLSLLEAATFPDDESPCKGIHVPSLFEENAGFARLRLSYRTSSETPCSRVGGCRSGGRRRPADALNGLLGHLLVFAVVKDKRKCLARSRNKNRVGRHRIALRNYVYR